MKKAIVLMAGLGLAAPLGAAPAESATRGHYADLAQAAYEDALHSARTLARAVEGLTGAPTPGRPGRLEGRPGALPADRGLPLRQSHRGRLGGKGERLARR